MIDAVEAADPDEDPAVGPDPEADTVDAPVTAAADLVHVRRGTVVTERTMPKLTEMAPMALNKTARKTTVLDLDLAIVAEIAIDPTTVAGAVVVREAVVVEVVPGLTGADTVDPRPVIAGQQVQTKLRTARLLWSTTRLLKTTAKTELAMRS